MSEETTQHIPDPRSFEERVFARFDDMDRRFDGLEARVEKIGIAWERRDNKEKLMWERLLAEILKVHRQLDEIGETVQEIIRN